jgi:hypothetical protein
MFPLDSDRPHGSTFPNAATSLIYVSGSDGLKYTFYMEGFVASAIDGENNIDV